MSYQVQNYEPPANSSYIPDHLDKLLVAQVMHHAHAHGHVGLWQGLPHGIQLQNRELSRASRRTQIYPQHLRPDLLPNFLQQSAVPTPDIQNSPHHLPVKLQRPQHRRMVTQYAVRQGKRTVRPLQYLGLHFAIQNLFLKGAQHLSV